MNTTSSSVCSSTDMEPPRKKRFRAKLDHMSAEEKQQRRKEKNRKAAQTARDRKRMNMDRLEEENRRLREENTKLRGQILGTGQQLPTQSQDTTTNPLPPLYHINDSGVSDVGSRSASSYLAESPKLSPPNGSPDVRTTTPDSTFFGQSTLSPAPSDDRFIDTMIQGDNDIALVDEVQKLVEFVETGSVDDASFESDALIHEPPLQVKEVTDTNPTTTVNSLGWTSIQLMLILLISRIHHRLSEKIYCCRKQLTRSADNDHLDPVNCNLYDYILHTKCMDFRRAAEAIISNKSNVRQQRLIALDFVHKYLCNVNLNYRRQQASNTIPIPESGCLVEVQQ